MALQSNSNVGLAYIAEVTWGTTPAGALSELRALNDSVEFKRNELMSEEFKTHRQLTNTILGSHSVDGSLNFEFGDFVDAWLEGALMGTFASNILKLGQTLKHFTLEKRMVGVGWYHRITGVRPNGLKLSLAPGAISQLEIPVIGRTGAVAADGLTGPTGWLVNNVAGYAAGSTTMTIDAGTTNFANLDQFVIYNAASTTVQRSEQIYTASSGSGTSVTFAPALDVAIVDNDILHAVRPATVITANDPYNTFSGTITEGGSSIAVVTNISLTVDQGQQPANVIGSAFPAAVVPGNVKVEGTMDLYVTNMALFTKFVNETYSTLQFALTNGSTTYTWLLPKIKYTGSRMNKDKGGSPMQMQLPWRAVYDGTELTSVKITKS